MTPQSLGKYLAGQDQLKEQKRIIRERLMNSTKRDSQSKETIPQLVMNEGMDLIVEEITDYLNEQIEAKKQFVGIIEFLFPIDAPFWDTANIGKKLLLEAIIESDWRDLPENILSLYAAKCEREESRQARNLKAA